VYRLSVVLGNGENVGLDLNVINDEYLIAICHSMLCISTEIHHSGQ
jgi:hypothetical protein